MMLPSHLLATLLACALLAHARGGLARREWLLALAFGVAIDLDHLLQLPTYVARHGIHALTPAAMLAWGGAWQGFLHTPWALVVVLGACAAFRSWTPLAFWGLHMVQDFVVARHLVRFGSPLEWGIVALLALALGAVLVRDHRAHGAAGAGLRAHAAARVAMLWAAPGLRSRR